MTYRLRTAFGFAGVLVIDLVTMVVTTATSSTPAPAASSEQETAEPLAARGAN